MRDARELNRPSLVPSGPHVGTRVPPIGVVEPYSMLRDAGVSPPAMQRAARKWMITWHPEHVYTNLRPGLPCVLAWLALQRGFPVTAVITPLQIDRSPEDIRTGLLELWHAVDARIELRDVYERDEWIAKKATILELQAVMRCVAPRQYGITLAPEPIEI